VVEDLRGGDRLRVIVTVAIVGGLLLGPIDLLAQRTLPYPWANLANSSAVWAIAAFGIGAWVRTGRWRPAIAGVVLLLVAVESYYLAATLIQKDDLSNLWSFTTLMWLLFGVLAGTVFGTAGGWSRHENRWLRVIGVALPGAVLLAEAGILVYRSGVLVHRSGVLVHRSGGLDAAYRTDSLQTAAIEAALGILLLIVLGRTARGRIEGLAAAVPLALIGVGGFVAAGFGG